VPDNTEYYIHRSGRTARAGRSGTVMVLATMLNHSMLKATAKRYAVHLEKQEVPTENAVNAIVCERMTVFLEDAYRKTTPEERELFGRYVPLVKQVYEKQPFLLTMLVDDFYHEHMHGAEDSREKSPSAPEPEKLQDLLEKSYEARARMSRERARRFLPMADELVEEEPELLAMLAANFDYSLREKEQRSKRQARRERSGGGHSKEGRRRH